MYLRFCNYKLFYRYYLRSRLYLTSYLSTLCVFYMVSHAEKIRQALTALGSARPKEIIAWIEKNFGDEEEVKPESFRGDLMGLAINHSSAHHYTGSNKILWFDQQEKTYRLATASEHEDYEKKRSAAPKKEHIIRKNETFTSKLSTSGQIVIPVEIREEMQFRAGDLLAFKVNSQGILELRKARLKVEYL